METIPNTHRPENELDLTQTVEWIEANKCTGTSFKDIEITEDNQIICQTEEGGGADFQIKQLIYSNQEKGQILAEVTLDSENQNTEGILLVDRASKNPTIKFISVSELEETLSQDN